MLNNWNDNKNQVIRLIILIILLAIVSFIPYKILFDETKSVCIHNYLFGFQCPLCGMTRAVYQTMHLQFASAFNYNVVVALLPLYLASDIATIFYHQNWLLLFKKIIIAAIIVVLLILYAYRILLHFYWN